jgi:site-specific DNA recombinase
MPKTDGTRKVCYMCYSKSKKCKTMIKAPTCDNKNWETDELESIIFGEIRKLAVDPDYLTVTRQRARAARETEDEARLLRSEADGLTSQISRLMDLYSLGSLSLSEVDSKIRPLAERRDKLEAELKAQAAREGALPAEEAAQIVQSFGDVLDRGDLTEIRLVLTSLIRKIVLDGDDIEIYWNFT